MDPICHTLTGAALGKAGLARRTRLGMGTLMIAANLPDIDVAVYATDTLVVSFRRGWTHGVLAQATLPLVLAGVMWAWDRRTRHRSAALGATPDQSARFGSLVLLSYVGVFSHVFLDFLNTYGVRLLMPFSDRWFYGDALFIVDPWMYVLLGGGVWLADRLDRRARPGAVRAARAALLCVALYVAGMLASTQAARAVVRDGLVRAGRPADSRFMVSPVPVNPFRREVIVDVGPRYEKGFVWFEPAPRFRPAGYGADKGFDQEDVSALMQTDLVRTYLKWARFPFFVVDRGTRPPTVLLNDYRYSDATARPGWAGFQLRLGTP